MTARAVQLSLVDGAQKSVGPMVGSVITGSNADLIAAVAPLYLTGSVLDVTYGRGMWWRRFTPSPFGYHDLAHDGVDFRALPYDDESWDTVCFDPPYVPRHGADRGIPKRDVDFRARYGLTESRSSRELELLIEAGLAECARVSRQRILAKCTDFTNGRRFQLGHVRVLEMAAALGLRCHDLIVHASGSGPGGGQIQEQQRARRAHSYLLVLA